MAAPKFKHTLPGQLGLPLDLPGEHYNLLHYDQRGIVIHWSALAAAGQRWIKLKPNDPRIPDLFNVDRGKDDTFITVNEFDGWRYIRLLRSLRAFYVDLDDHLDLYQALDTLTDARLPGPNMVVWSGTGMHLYWLLEPLPPKCLPVWQRCQDALIRALKPLGADSAAKDCTRLLRVVGTRNRGEEVQGLVLDGHRWALRQIAFEILGTEGKKKAEVRDIRARRTSPDKAIQGSIYARWHLVFQDLLAISSHYGHSIPEGYRDKWLFLSGVALSWFTDAEGIEDEIIGLAHKHTDLAQPEIRQAMQPTLKRAMLAASGHKVEWQGQKIDPRYRFRRQTLYDWIGDLIPASLLPKMRAIIPDDEADRRDKARNRATEGRYATNYTGQGVRASNEEKRATARLLRAQGYTYRAIAAELGISDMSVRRWCVDET
ncbi:replication protein [Acidithiobacillus ferridurans]|uniref:helix-turn-helix domain-containing protein n=1 Tax=Acidithiobacillus ferridurans TaxID=1232575 RepID=UPI001C07CF43|nr:helix-turn-helix domain-containing protein [Acidithiobacillus ferridurans]MBU2719355.1 replication protein [Acidithiobacillus ferridurans]MBU2733465.1 replication protein [Acidithiobacillus ferridurans]